MTNIDHTSGHSPEMQVCAQGPGGGKTKQTGKKSGDVGNFKTNTYVCFLFPWLKISMKRGYQWNRPW